MNIFYWLLNRINCIMRRLNFRFLVLILIFLMLNGKKQLFAWSAVGVPGNFNGWTTNNCYLKTNLGATPYWGYTTTVTVGDQFKIQADSWANNWGSGYWITSYDQRWSIPPGGANAQIQGTPKTYVHFCIQDPVAGQTNRVGIMTLSALPISVTSVTDNSGGEGVGISEPVHIRITLSGAKSAEEKIYVRYTSDNWASDGFVLASASNTTIYTCSIPPQNKVCTVSYYVLTTTLTWSAGNDLDNYPDLMTIKYNNNNGSNYSYIVNKVGAKVIDGDPSDWHGISPSVENQATISSNEWIWKDKTGDRRSDPANPDDYDLTEARITSDSNYIFFLFKFADITSSDETYVAISVDIDTNSSDAGMNWIGDDANTFLGGDYSLVSNSHFGEYNIIIHNSQNGITRIERYTNTGNWHSPPSPPYDTGCYISANSNTVEVAIARADLGLAGNSIGRFTIATFDNVVGWANVTNTTGDYGTSDALDSISVIPKTTGTNQGTDMFNDDNYQLSAWDEDISDGDIDFWFDLRFDNSGKISNSKPSAPSNPYPADGSTNIGTFTPTLSWSPATDSDAGDAVTGYLLEMSTTSNLDGTVLYRVNISGTNWSTPTLPDGVTIYWRVRARDRSGALSDSPIWTFNTPYLPPPAPTVPVFTPIIDGEKDTLWGNNMSCTSVQSNLPANYAPGFYVTNDPEYLYLGWILMGDPWDESGSGYDKSAHYEWALETHRDPAGETTDPFLSSPTTVVNWALKPDFWVASWIKTGMTNFGGIFLYQASGGDWVSFPVDSDDVGLTVGQWCEIRLSLNKLGLKLNDRVDMLNYFRPAEDKPGVSDTAPFDLQSSDYADTNATITKKFAYEIRYALINGWHIPSKEDVVGFGKMRTPLNPTSSDKVKLYIGINPAGGIDSGKIYYTTNNWATIFSNTYGYEKQSGGYTYLFAEIGPFSRNTTVKYFNRFDRNGMITYNYGNDTNSSVTSNYSTAQANAFTFVVSNSAPTAPTEVTLSPLFVDTNTPLVATSSGSIDVDGDALKYYFEWYKNGVYQFTTVDSNSPYTSTNNPANLSPGDKWFCKVRVSDGYKYSDYIQSDSVNILLNTWTELTNADVDSAIVTNSEWIWFDKENDTRGDLSDAPNYDIKEVHIKSDVDNLYILVRMKDITSINLPLIAVSIDTDRSPTDTSTNIIGDDSDTTLDGGYYLTSPERLADINLIIHTVSWNNPEIEYLKESGNWYTMGNDTVNIFDSSDIIEIVIPRTNIGIYGAKIARISIASFKNRVGYANDIDTTYDLSGSDVVDVITIPAISDTNVIYNDNQFSLNTYDEEIFDDDIDFWVDIFLGATNIRNNTLPTVPTSLSPPNNGTTNTLTPSFTWAASSDSDTNDSVTSYLFELNNTTNFSKDVIYRINLRTNYWKVPEYLPYGYTNYYWRVRARDRAGALSIETNIWKFSVTAGAPVANRPLDDKNVNNFGYYNGLEDADGTVVWYWTASTDINGISHYYIDIGTSPNGTNILHNYKLTNVTSFTATNLTSGYTYYARIRAENGLGIIGDYSEPSDGIYVNKRKMDGNTNDWGIGSYPTNTLIVSNKEAVWQDKLGDVRNSITNLDLLQFRTIADKYNIYFFLRFNTSIGFKDGSHFIQIAVDNGGSSANRAFIGRNITSADLYVSGDMPWEYDIKILSGLDTATICDATYGNWQAGVYTENTNTGFIEVAIPLSKLGGSDLFLGKTVTFSVAVFSNNNGNIEPIDGDTTPDALDVISDISTTWGEISDQVVNYSLSITFDNNGDVIDAAGNSSATIPNTYPQTSDSWKWAQNAILYNMFVDRFENGNSANDPSDPVRFGGDFQGLIDKMSYFRELGINTLYLSPVMEFGGGCTGYGVDHWWKVEDGFGGDSDFKKFLREARNNYFNVVIDWPGTAVGYSQPIRDEHPDWISIYKSPWGGWPEFCVGMAEVQQYMADLKRFWLAKGVRGFREDYAKFDGNPVDDGHKYWQQVMAKVLKTFPDFYNFGEVFDGAYKISTYVWNGIELKGCFDFPLKYSTVDWMSGTKDSGTFRSDVDSYENTYGNNPIMVSFIDNHDVDRILRTMNWDSWKVRRGFGFTLTHCIPPKIFYGTETGMDGYRIGTDLDHSPCIDPMKWDFSYPQYGFFKHLIKGRRSFPGLRSDKGSRVWKYTSGQWLIYERNYYQDAILVIINQSSTSANAPTGSFTTWANRTWRDWMNWSDYFTTDATGHFTSTITVQGNDLRVLVSREFGGGGFGAANLQGNTGVPGTIVGVWNYAKDIVSRVTKSDSSGNYFISDIVCKDTGGEAFKVQFWAPGYEMKTVTTVTLYDNTTTTLDVSLVPDTTPPSTPQGFSVKQGDKMVELDWDDNPEEDIDSYKVYRATSYDGPYTLIDTVLRSAYIDHNVTNNITYYYKIRAKDRNGNLSGYSKILSVTPNPIDVTFWVDVSDSGLNVKKVYLAGNSEKMGFWGILNPNLEMIDAGNGWWKVTVKLDPRLNIEYKFVINDGNNDIWENNFTGSYSYYNNRYFSLYNPGNGTLNLIHKWNVPGLANPRRPYGIVLSPKNQEIDIGWNNIDTEPYIDYYTIYRSTDGINFTSIARVEREVGKYFDVGLSNGTQYWYYLTATDLFGNTSENSVTNSAVPTVTDTIPPKPVTGISIYALSTNSLKIEWNPNTEADLAGYNIYRSYVSNSGFVKLNESLISGTTNPFWIDNTAVYGTNYYYRVEAVDFDNNASSFTETASAYLVKVKFIVDMGEINPSSVYIVGTPMPLDTVSGVTMSKSDIYTFEYTTGFLAGETIKYKYKYNNSVLEGDFSTPSRYREIYVPYTHYLELNDDWEEIPDIPQGVWAFPWDKKVDIYWDAVTSAEDLKGYNIYWTTNANYGNFTKYNSTPVTGTSTTVTGLSNNVTYYFVVKAVDGGTIQLESPASKIVEAIPKKSQPVYFKTMLLKDGEEYAYVIEKDGFRVGIR